MGSYKNHRPSEPESDTKLNAQSHDYKEEPESTKRSLSPLNLQDNISQNRRQEIGHGLAAFARGGVRRSRTPPRAKAERAPARSALARRPSPAAASGVKANRTLQNDPKATPKAENRANTRLPVRIRSEAYRRLCTYPYCRHLGPYGCTTLKNTAIS